MLRIAVVVTLCFLPAVVAKQPLYCSEPKDKHGLTCSQYLKSGVGTLAILFDWNDKQIESLTFLYIKNFYSRKSPE